MIKKLRNQVEKAINENEYNLVKEKTRQRVSVLHNNLRMDNFICKVANRDELLKNAPSSNGEAYSLPSMME